MAALFTWAENVNGKLVHVDSVPNGLACKCVCPYCHEQLLARHGDINEHGFAHHSENRRANLKICYMVTLYKLAEQIIQTKKQIHVPSYYGIFKETDIKFIDVQIDCRFEREDKQPDVIATTEDNSKYLIEFIFDYKVQHKQPIDYKNLTCLEINLNNQTLETLDEFLLSSNTDKRWVNNDIYFNKIERRYKDAGKPVNIVSKEHCRECKLRHNCCAVKNLPIENNGQIYHLCKIDLYKKRLEELNRQQQEWEEYRKQQEIKRRERLNELRKIKAEQKSHISPTQTSGNQNSLPQNRLQNEYIESDRSCFNCVSNLSWKNRDGLANCGCYMSLGIPKRNNPEYAINCQNFREKQKP